MSGPLLTVAGTGGSLLWILDATCFLAVRLPRVVTSEFVSAPPAQTTVQSFLILGTDAVLAARPATPVQLAHACAALGFDVVIPATWGDEIIAQTLAQRVRDKGTPVVQCSCPLVARRFAEHTGVLDGMVMRFVPPPVATARYLRAVYGQRVPRITYAGDCPVASASIDEHLSCASLFERLAERGIAPDVQPTEFDSVIPPDRRRHFSEPGGVPTREALRRAGTRYEVVELPAGDVSAELAQHLLSGERVIVDIATAVGCRCSGAGGDPQHSDPRARVRAHEPPRAPSPVVDASIGVLVDVEMPPLPAPAMETAPIDQEAESEAAESEGEPVLVGADPSLRRRSPAGSTRAVMGTMPLSRADSGRQLPRLYVARRRSSPRGLRQSTIRREAPSATPVAESAPRSVPVREAARDWTRLVAADSPRAWMVIALVGLAAGVLIALLLAAIG